MPLIPHSVLVTLQCVTCHVHVLMPRTTATTPTALMPNAITRGCSPGSMHGQQPRLHERSAAWPLLTGIAWPSLIIDGLEHLNHHTGPLYSSYWTALLIKPSIRRSRWAGRPSGPGTPGRCCCLAGRPRRRRHSSCRECRRPPCWPLVLQPGRPPAPDPGPGLPPHSVSPPSRAPASGSPAASGGHASW